MRRAPAWWRRLRAWAGGWFWLPCPRCGKHFAGYEVCRPEVNVTYHQPYHQLGRPGQPSRIVCASCAGKPGTTPLLPW